MIDSFWLNNNVTVFFYIKFGQKKEQYIAIIDSIHSIILLLIQLLNDFFQILLTAIVCNIFAGILIISEI
jgi:hypothetical protein